MPKRASIEFVPSREIEGVRVKFGGEPFGFPLSLWPASKQLEQPMQFICQIPFSADLFPGVEQAVAYLFMTHGDGDQTWVPDGGENAVIIIPEDQLTDSLTTGEAPRLCRMVKKLWHKQLVPQTSIYTTTLSFSDDPEFIPDARLRELPENEQTKYRDTLEGNKLGGAPSFLQSDELPIREPWHLLLQLDSTQVPFWINFGDAGIGYAFINGAGTEGKFLWQCC